MKVLEFKYRDIYTIQVVTKDVTTSWAKFKGRAVHPGHNCRYRSSTSGELRLYDYNEKRLEILPPERYDDAWPVFFETNVYSFTIIFANLKEGTTPRLIHADRKVEELFNATENKGFSLLCGSIDFLNQPGQFSLQFSYVTPDGERHLDHLEFDVVSPKMDIKEDLNKIIQQIRIEYGDLVFRYLTLTFHQFELGDEANNEVIWLSVFRRIIDEYIIAVRYILHAPHNKDCTYSLYQKPDRIKKWTNALAEEFSEDKANDFDKAVHTYYRTEQIESTNDTRENRFVKYTIEYIHERLRTIIDKVNKEDTSQSEVLSLSDYAEQLETLKCDSFFRPIGKFEGFKQESMVLQQRSGYSQVYRFWIMLQNGLDLLCGDTSVGAQPIWKLYELWCFLKLKNIVCEVLDIDRHNPSDQQYIEENTHNQADPFSGGNLTGNVTYTNKFNSDKVEVIYQYSFNRKNTSVPFRSLTGEQKPDIVMHIHKSNGFTLTYLFDAKYRVSGDDDNTLSKSEDEPVEETINQMHRYRDAIYYSTNPPSVMSKEVVGGYVLFPGRVKEAEKLSLIDQGRYDELPYYLSSIHYVNIGAFPLLPKEDSGLLLKHFIKSVLLDESVKDQIEDSIPQRGLYYSYEEEDCTPVIVGCYKNDEHHQWIQDTLRYNLRLDKNRKGAVNLNNDYVHAQFLILYKIGANSSREIYKIAGEPEVLTAEELLDMNYPDPGGRIYLTLKLDPDVDERLKGRLWDLSSDLFDTTGGAPVLIRYLNLLPPEDS